MRWRKNARVYCNQDRSLSSASAVETCQAANKASLSTRKRNSKRSHPQIWADVVRYNSMYNPSWFLCPTLAMRQRIHLWFQTISLSRFQPRMKVIFNARMTTWGKSLLTWIASWCRSSKSIRRYQRRTTNWRWRFSRGHKISYNVQSAGSINQRRGAQLAKTPK